MAIFEDITLTFDGADYVVKANDAMKLIAKVEDVITLAQLSNPEKVKLNQLALAYTVALKHAGADVTHEQVYAALFDVPEDGGVHPIAAAIQNIQLMLVPPSTYKPVETKKKSPKRKPKAAK